MFCFVFLVGFGDKKLTEFQKMLIVRSLCPDRFLSCVTSFIVKHLGSCFMEPPVLDMKAVSFSRHSLCSWIIIGLQTALSFFVCLRHYILSCWRSLQVVEESSSCVPLIFILSPGVDPTGALLQLAEASGRSRDFHALSLGQGQAPIAKHMIEEGVRKGAEQVAVLLCVIAVAESLRGEQKDIQLLVS